MKGGERLSLEQIRAFVEASGEVEFQGRDQEEVYAWVNETLQEHGYRKLGRAGKGLLRRYVAKMTGLSRAQVTRLITRYQQDGAVKPRRYQRHRFTSRYTSADIELLAKVDEAHETLSGPATRKILQREFHDFGHAGYQRLARISVAHIYRLRATRTYRHRRIAYQPTRPAKVAIGERRTPGPLGRPGYLRVDSVHQGDLHGVKGVYHINAVDEVTQYQIVGATAQISEAWLLPVLADMLEQFPFQIRGFHSDNGSEYINKTVEKLLNKLLIEQTKSRPNRCNDNGLVESKNGAVVRKHMGYGHIAAPHAEAIAAFYREHFNPYLNFHRPCGVPEPGIDGKGKPRKRYRWYATPWEILRQLPDVARYLRPTMTIEELDRRAGRMSDTEAAMQMREARRKAICALAEEDRMKRRDSHIPTATTAVSLIFKTKTGRRTVVSGKVEIEKHDSHFPTDPIACRARKELVDGVLCGPADPKPRKETS